jgi:hypothetical protein
MFSLRSLLFSTAVWALFSPAMASAQAGGTPCHATPQEARKQVPWAGNTADIQWSSDQPDCKVDAGGLPWITVSVMPPGTGSASQRVLRYSVDTNFSPVQREGKIQVGDATVTIEQAGGPAPGMAYSPSHLDFTFTPGKGAQEDSKTLFVGSDQPLQFTAKPAETAPWIKVKDGSTAGAPQAQRSFQVTVTAAGKPPGVYQGTIQVDAPGASNAKELVSVTMTVEKAQAQ